MNIIINYISSIRPHQTRAGGLREDIRDLWGGTPGAGARELRAPAALDRSGLGTGTRREEGDDTMRKAERQVAVGVALAVATGLTTAGWHAVSGQPPTPAPAGITQP